MTECIISAGWELGWRRLIFLGWKNKERRVFFCLVCRKIFDKNKKASKKICLFRETLAITVIGQVKRGESPSCCIQQIRTASSWLVVVVEVVSVPAVVAEEGQFNYNSGLRRRKKRKAIILYWIWPDRIILLSFPFLNATHLLSMTKDRRTTTERQQHCS